MLDKPSSMCVEGSQTLSEAFEYDPHVKLWCDDMDLTNEEMLWLCELVGGSDAEELEILRNRMMDEVLLG